MRRRQFLTLAGACAATGSAALAGCGGLLDGGTAADDPAATGTTASDARTTGSTSPATTQPMPTSAPEQEPLSALTVGKVLRYAPMLGSSGVLTDRNRQYVVALVPEGDPSETYVLRTPTQSYRSGLPGAIGGVGTHSVGGIEHPRQADATLVGFEVPSPLDVDRVAIVETAGDQRAWQLGADHVATLAASSPSFAMRSLEVPDSVHRGETLPVSMTVENTSDVGGRLLVAIHLPTPTIADDDEVTVVDRSVAARETVPVELSIDTGYWAHEARDVTLALRGHVEAEQQVQILPPETTVGSSE